MDALRFFLCREFKSIFQRFVSTFFSPIIGISKTRAFPERVYSFEEEEEQKREMTFDPRTRRTGNVLIASCLFCFASGVYYYAATGGRGLSFGINDASSSSSSSRLLDDDVQRAVDARERKKTRDATEEDTTKRRRRRREEEEEEAKGRHRRFFWQKKKQ